MSLRQRRVAPTFVAPAFSAVRWGVGFIVAMVAHQPLGWLCLGLFIWRYWQMLMRLNIYIGNRVKGCGSILRSEDSHGY